MQNKQIVLRGARKLKKKETDQIIRIHADTYNDLVDLANETGFTMKSIVYQIISQVVQNNIIIVEREE